MGPWAAFQPKPFCDTYLALCQYPEIKAYRCLKQCPATVASGDVRFFYFLIRKVLNNMCKSNKLENSDERKCLF